MMSTMSILPSQQMFMLWLQAPGRYFIQQLLVMKSAKDKL